MTIRQTVVLTLTTLVLSTQWSCGEARTPEVVRSFDHSYALYGEVLRAYVDDGGWVDYERLVADTAGLHAAIVATTSIPADSLGKFSEDRTLAFWINAYNILTLKSIVDAYPVESIRDIDGVWDKHQFHVGGRDITLNAIEHEILREEFDEPRIHLAIVCASASCPALRNEPYRGDAIKDQLRYAAQAFLNDPARNSFDPTGNRAGLSEIFDWFGEDFIREFGTEIPGDQPEKVRAALNFISAVLPDSVSSYLGEEGLTIKHLPYDWGLNSQRSQDSTAGPTDN